MRTTPAERRHRRSAPSGVAVITVAESKRAKLARKVAALTYRILLWGDARLPLGARSVVGVLFMVGGVFGWVPILGFWMFPLGLAFVALDIPPARHKIHAWMNALKARAER